MVVVARQPTAIYDSAEVEKLVDEGRFHITRGAHRQATEGAYNEAPLFSSDYDPEVIRECFRKMVVGRLSGRFAEPRGAVKYDRPEVWQDHYVLF